MKPTPIILAGLLVAACNQPGPDPTVCVSPAVAEGVANARRIKALEHPRLRPVDREAIETQWADACLQRWAYRLQGSDAGLGDKRVAVLGACHAEASALGAAWLAPDHGHNAEDWQSRRATFYIVQAQAGGCRAPERRSR